MKRDSSKVGFEDMDVFDEESSKMSETRQSSLLHSRANEALVSLCLCAVTSLVCCGLRLGSSLL